MSKWLNLAGEKFIVGTDTGNFDDLSFYTFTSRWPIISRYRSWKILLGKSIRITCRHVDKSIGTVETWCTDSQTWHVYSFRACLKRLEKLREPCKFEYYPSGKFWRNQSFKKLLFEFRVIPWDNKITIRSIFGHDFVKLICLGLYIEIWRKFWKWEQNWPKI